MITSHSMLSCAVTQSHSPKVIPFMWELLVSSSGPRPLEEALEKETRRAKCCRVSTVRLGVFLAIHDVKNAGRGRFSGEDRTGMMRIFKRVDVGRQDDAMPGLELSVPQRRGERADVATFGAALS